EDHREERNPEFFSVTPLCSLCLCGESASEFAMFDAFHRSIARRTFLTQSAYGLGGLALTALLGRAAEPRWRGVVNPPHFPPKAKRVIHLCMAGGPSQFETLDYKPKLKALNGKPFPESF